MDKRKLTVIAQEGEYILYEYKPTLIRLLYFNMESFSLVRRVRLLLEYLSSGRYKVYYLFVDGELVGYDVITPGGRRLKVSTINDVVSGPTFIKSECRGKGYGKLLKKLVIKKMHGKADRMLCWVDKKNVSSLRMHESVGFEIIGSLDVVGKMRRLVDYDNPEKGEDYIYSINLK